MIQKLWIFEHFKMGILEQKLGGFISTHNTLFIRMSNFWAEVECS